MQMFDGRESFGETSLMIPIVLLLAQASIQ